MMVGYNKKNTVFRKRRWSWLHICIHINYLEYIYREMRITYIVLIDQSLSIGQFPGLERFPGEGNGNLLWYSCLVGYSPWGHKRVRRDFVTKQCWSIHLLWGKKVIFPYFIVVIYKISITIIFYHFHLFWSIFYRVHCFNYSVQVKNFFSYIEWVLFF